MGEHNVLKVVRLVRIGAILDDGEDGILLPIRDVPQGIQVDDDLKVFICHDSEDRLIATTRQPRAMLGEIAFLKAVSVTRLGAFLDWGLMKDLFVPKSQQVSFMRTGGEYLVRVYLDEKTGRLAATEKIDQFLTNETLTIKEKDQVKLTMLRQTDLGYIVIINHRHTGLLHFDDVYREVYPGDRFPGFIKKIHPGNKIDVVAGKPGYEKVEDESRKILDLLINHGGYLPFHDKSSPQDVYSFFSMSKKTFKMATGLLYKQRRIEFMPGGIRLIE